MKKFVLFLLTLTSLNNLDAAEQAIQTEDKHEFEEFQEIATLSGNETRTDLLNINPAVSVVRWSPDGRYLAYGCCDDIVHIIKVWDSQSNRFVHTFQQTGGIDHSIHALSWSTDGTKIISGDYDTINMWDMNSGECLRWVKEHTSSVHAVDCSPDARSFVSASADKTIKLWDINSGKCTKTFQDNFGVYTVSYSPNGTELASGSGQFDTDNSIKFWDRRQDGCIKRLRGHAEPVNTVHWLANRNNLIKARGYKLVSGSLDKTVKLWAPWNDMTGSEHAPVLLQTFQGHNGQVNSVSSSQDDSLLASASLDTTIRILSSLGGCLQVLRGHTQPTTAVSFSKNGLLASGSWDKTVKIWSQKKEQDESEE